MREIKPAPKFDKYGWTPLVVLGSLVTAVSVIATIQDYYLPSLYARRELTARAKDIDQKGVCDVKKIPKQVSYAWDNRIRLIFTGGAILKTETTIAPDEPSRGLSRRFISGGAKIVITGTDDKTGRTYSVEYISVNCTAPAPS